MKLTRKVVASCVAVILLVGIVYFSASYFGSPAPCPLPEYSWYNGHVQDLLILEGSCVVATAVDAITDKSLERRPFIIAFLGNGAHKEALPALERIVEDETDPDRGPALIAIFLIDREEGRRLARAYRSNNGHFGEITLDILMDKKYLYRRTSYLEALRNYIAVRHSF